MKCECDCEACEACEYEVWVPPKIPLRRRVKWKIRRGLRRVGHVLTFGKFFKPVKSIEVVNKILKEVYAPVMMDEMFRSSPLYDRLKKRQEK